MKIQEAKDLLVDLYKKSLCVYNPSANIHPVRVVESSKSIVGIDPENPIKNILSYCSKYVDEFQLSEKFCEDEKADIPLVVSYLDLELSLMHNNREKSFVNVFNLLKVSEGAQILEFLLEFSLKYCASAYFLIWSVYRMELFLKFENIKESLILCVEYILNDDKVERSIVDVSIDDFLMKMNFNENTYKDLISLYNMYNNKFIRKDKINPYILSVIAEKYESNKEFDEKMNILKDQRKYGRKWVLLYLNGLELNNINYNLILNLDAARGAIKVLKNKKETDFIWNGLNKIL
tara:strand:- start:47 stop:919 length:873 start_codon:yes stop_codon:yes gene_type:complete